MDNEIILNETNSGSVTSYQFVRVRCLFISCQGKKSPLSRQGTQMTCRDKKGVSQIAEYATPSIWGNPTVTCVGSNAGVWSLQDNMEMLEVLSSQSVRIKIP